MIIKKYNNNSEVQEFNIEDLNIDNATYLIEYHSKRLNSFEELEKKAKSKKTKTKEIIKSLKAKLTELKKKK